MVNRHSHFTRQNSIELTHSICIHSSGHFYFPRDPEKIHDTVRGVGAAVARTPLKHLLKAVYGYSHPMLQQEALGLTFDNPIGLAAGFDKHAELMDE
jgi:dihydroorotate dehydrogenase